MADLSSRIYDRHSVNWSMELVKLQFRDRLNGTSSERVTNIICLQGQAKYTSEVKEQRKSRILPPIKIPHLWDAVGAQL